MFKFNMTNKKANNAAIAVFILFILCYYDICIQPDLEKFNVKEQIPAPQNNVIIHDCDIADAIKHQQKVSADFNRMYNELKGWKKITWPSQPVDSVSWFRKIHPSPPYKHAPTMRQYRQYIYNYEMDLYDKAKKISETKYANCKGKSK